MNFRTQTPYEARKGERVPKLMEHKLAFAKLPCSSWAGSSRLHTAQGCVLPQLLLCLQSILGHRIQHCDTINKLPGTLPVLFHYMERHLSTETFLLFRTSSSWVYLTSNSLTLASFLSTSHTDRFHDSRWHIILPLHLQSLILLESGVFAAHLLGFSQTIPRTVHVWHHTTSSVVNSSNGELSGWDVNTLIMD